MVAQVSGPPHLAARFGEGQFLVLMLDTGPQGLRKTGELLRQSIERTTPINNGNRIALQASPASAGAARRQPGGVPEADRTGVARGPTGRRRPSCFADGKGQEPVESLDLRTEYREVAV